MMWRVLLTPSVLIPIISIAYVMLYHLYLAP